MKTTAEPIADDVITAAARLGISRSLLYILMKDKEIQKLKVRGRTIISRAEQQRYLASLTQSDAA